MMSNMGVAQDSADAETMRTTHLAHEEGPSRRNDIDDGSVTAYHSNRDCSYKFCPFVFSQTGSLTRNNRMVCFKITGGEIVPEIDMVASKTILDLKLEIEKELGVEVERQKLWYNARELRNHEVIQWYKFRECETLNLRVRLMAEERRKVHVLVKQEGANGYVRVRETEKVSHLRKKVEKYWGIPQSLFTLRRFHKHMEDDLPLIAYYITEDTEVELCLNIEPR